MKKLLILVMAFSMGLAGMASATRGSFKYYRWNTGTGLTAVQQYQRDFSTAASATYTVNSALTFVNSSLATLGVETPTWANGDNYGGRFDGWLLPPVDGKYTFYISTDDSSELWLSTDDKAANVKLIASVTGYSNQRQWDKFASQKSAEITLEAGKAYFFYAVWRDGTGGDGCNVGWSCPAAGIPNPVVIDRFYVTEETASIIPGLSKFPGAVEYELWQKPEWYNLADGSDTAAWTTLMRPDGTNWRLPPDFSVLGAPTYTGTFDMFTEGYANRFIYRQYGIVQVPADGLLSLAITSDDGSRIYVGEWWTGGKLTEVVNNDGSHGMQLRYGTIPVKAGYVGIVAKVFQGTGGVGFQAYYYNDTIPYQEIPVSALFSRNVACRYSPAMDARNVAPNVVLKWSQPLFKSSFTNQVYLAKVGEALAKVYDGTDSSFAPTLENNTKYRWRVDIIEPNLAGPNPVIAKGPTWGFMTGTGITITTQPLPVAFYDFGGTAKFTVVATSSLPLTYQWYKDGFIMDGATNPELVVSNVQATNLGGYYCVVSNGNTAEDKTSSTAMLSIKRLVAYYPFDADAKDMSGNGHDGTIVTRNVDPNKLPGFVPGVKGNAIQFNGVDQYVNAGTWSPQADSGQITISMWARWEPTGTTTGDRWQGIIGKRQAWNATDSCWQIEMSFDGLNGNPNFPQISGLAQNAVGTGTARFLDWNYLGLERTVGGTANASLQYLPNEGFAKAFDNDGTTKWYAAANTGWITYDFKDEEAYTITFYTLTTGNDNQGRDPKSWTLQGSNDGGATWTVVDTRSAVTLGTNRRATYRYDVATPGSYKMYKLNITEVFTPSGNGVQLTEIQLFEPAADPSQTWKWHHVAVTYDGVTSRLLIDGVQQVSATTFRFGPKTDAQISIGGGELPLSGAYGNRFLGSIDDVMIYNYGMTNLEVGNLYAAITGASFCTGNPQYDFNANCVVDLADMMLFMSQWLQCNELGAGACN
jgi:hypothetical protein